MGSMTSTIPALAIRARLGKHDWSVPRTFGPDGWSLIHRTERGKIIITAAPAPDEPDGTEDWWHASMSWAERLPSYGDLTRLHKAVWPDGWAYEVFAPPASHVNIHPYARHLWGRPDGRAVLPDFGAHGTI